MKKNGVGEGIGGKTVTEKEKKKLEEEGNLGGVNDEGSGGGSAVESRMGKPP
jgi:hypothetical protein